MFLPVHCEQFISNGGIRMTQRKAIVTLLVILLITECFVSRIITVLSDPIYVGHDTTVMYVTPNNDIGTVGEIDITWDGMLPVVTYKEYPNK